MTKRNEIKNIFDRMLPNEKICTHKFVDQLKNPENYNVNSKSDRVNLLKQYEKWMLNQ